MVKVLQSWGVDHIYGIPGGSINSTMDALYRERDAIRYVQVRHEETGALAAAVDAKLTGKIGVCSGSAGPGAPPFVQRPLRCPDGSRAHVGACWTGCFHRHEL